MGSRFSIYVFTLFRQYDNFFINQKKFNIKPDDSFPSPIRQAKLI